jgi:predicted transcriptional regulator
MGFEQHAFSIRLPEHLRAELDALAEAMDRSRAYIVKEAIEAYVNERRQYIEELKAARESALHGPLHSSEQIFAWMDSWGTDKELPPPEPDIAPDRNT